MFEPIRRQSVSDAVFSQLRARILNGTMAPGEALPAERVLCRMLGVNRQAVREALRRLQQARLISVQHGGSTRVLDYRASSGLDLLGELLVRADGSLDTRAVRSLVEMRALLAPEVARLCALRGGSRAADALEQLTQAMQRAANDPTMLHQLVFDYWDALVTGADNVAYRLIFNTLRQTYAKVQDLLTPLVLEELQELASYREIARAVRKADGARAARSAARLIAIGARKITVLVDGLERATDAPKAPK